jgi:membrane protease YdiL (CAAX protease family)
MSKLRRVLNFPLVRVLITLVVFGVLSAALSLLFALARLPDPALLSEGMLALAAVAALALVAQLVERRTAAEVGLWGPGAPRDLAAGFLIGAALLSLVIGVLALAGWYRVLGLGWATPGEQLAGLLRALLLFLLVAVFEETLFRGIIFRAIEDGLGSWVALVVSAGFFGAAHLANPGASGASAAAIAIEAGLLLGAAYMLTRNLWLPIGIHWAWNLFEGPIYGTAVSGTSGGSLLRSDTAGPEAWTGGAFGPEAGLVAVILATLLGLAMLALAVRRGRLITPAWMRRRAPAAQPSPAGGE